MVIKHYIAAYGDTNCITSSSDKNDSYLYKDNYLTQFDDQIDDRTADDQHQQIDELQISIIISGYLFSYHRNRHINIGDIISSTHIGIKN